MAIVLPFGITIAMETWVIGTSAFTFAVSLISEKMGTAFQPSPLDQHWGSKRSTIANQATMFQINDSELRLSDLRRLHGLWMNMTAPDGTAVFTSTGDAKHDGIEGMVGMATVTHAPPNHGVQRGGLSFTIPGLDTPVNGTWISVPESRDLVNDEEAQAFNELYEGILARRQRAHKTPDAFDRYMQLRHDAQESREG
ncbi:uncharacterized protein LTR77_009709 [Saxophila tyrrhenica]|uniref:Uncharacterized protein n=1 Tax=Saxophila tyrrhenica TaxID=1690608 RepID=A0AAV9NXP5_9PEZI|nr:hypothetical protein LTR77_009709 [Saxophila tyrrhenica]